MTGARSFPKSLADGPHHAGACHTDTSELTIIGQPHDTPTRPHTAPPSFQASFGCDDD